MLTDKLFMGKDFAGTFGVLEEWSGHAKNQFNHFIFRQELVSAEEKISTTDCSKLFTWK